MLSEELKSVIQTLYNKLLSAKGFKARYCQKLMIADIARTIGAIEDSEEDATVPAEVASDDKESDDHIAVIQAGTGTGKTIAYLIACLPLAKAKNKKLVISTATIALQEQIVFKDLPDVKRHLPELEFEFAIAKGRRRYACMSQLDRILKEGDAFNLSLGLYDDEIAQANLDKDAREICANMLDKIGRGKWDGDRERWEKEMDDSVWNKLSMDHSRCSGRSCSFYDNCCFYKAREGIYRADCIVANHDLVLSDLLMGGGVVLPAPEETIYVFDEGHHLPEKAVNHLSHFTRLRSAQSWLEQIPDSLERMSKELGDMNGVLKDTSSCEQTAESLVQLTGHFLQHIEFYAAQAESKFGMQVRQHRFQSGDCTQPLRDMAADLNQDFERLYMRLEDIQDELQKQMTNPDFDLQMEYEAWYPLIASYSARADANRLLWRDYMHADKSGDPPQARWLNFSDEATDSDVQINSSPVSIGEQLHELLWSKAFAAIVTSATLAVNGDFFRYAQKAGIGADANMRVLPSPFNYQEQGILQIPAMKVDPRNPDAHSEAVAELLPDLIRDSMGSLVLFTSWRQMRMVEELLDDEFSQKLLMQGELGKTEILKTHKIRVEEGVQSIIFGLASFAEGVDLPGDLCAHVVVVKIPFSVPDDPVDATYSEWLESQGRNSFEEVSIPDAILKLYQACGRLIRTEEDTGLVSILDTRLLSKRYGAKIIDSLPPFKRAF